MSWETDARALLKAIRLECMDDRGMLTDGPGRTEVSQHAQVFGVLTGALTSASGTVHTPRGDLNVAWEKGAGGIQVQISGDADAISRIMAN